MACAVQLVTRPTLQLPLQRCLVIIVTWARSSAYLQRTFYAFFTVGGFDVAETFCNNNVMVWLISCLGQY